MRRQPPCGARPQKVEHGVHQLSRCRLARSSASSCIRDHRRDQRPSHVGQISVVAPPFRRLPLRHRASARVVGPTPHESHQGRLGNPSQTRSELFLKEVKRLKNLEELESEVIKWSRNLRRSLEGLSKVPLLSSVNQSKVCYRPFVSKTANLHPLLIDETGGQLNLFSQQNKVIAFLSGSSSNPLAALATNLPVDYGLLKKGNGGTQSLPRYTYVEGRRIDNITDWALAQFRARYPDDAITKDDIFAYCYAALHDPLFRETHAADLRREFPRVPLHDGFVAWRDWGRALLVLHIDYEKAKPFKLTRVDTPGKAGRTPTPKLKSAPEKGLVVVDSDTQLTGIPRQAWDYRLGNRSAIDWVLDQHKEKTIRDETVRAKFNSYRFADYKESMIALLAKVVRVSVDTVAITQAMRALPR